MISRVLPAVAVLLLVAPEAALAGSNPVVHGLTLPRGSQKLSANRYLSPYDVRLTKKFFRKLFSREGKWGGKRIRQVMNIPAAKVVHIANSRPKDGWSGVNISLYKGNTYIFVLGRKEYPDPKNVRPLTENKAPEEATEEGSKKE